MEGNKLQSEEVSVPRGPELNRLHLCGFVHCHVFYHVSYVSQTFHHQMPSKWTISVAAHLPTGAAAESSWAWRSCNSKLWQTEGEKVTCTAFTSPVESRGSRLYYFNFQVLMSGASYLQIMKQQQVKPSESSTGSFQMLCIGLWLSATFYVNFDTLKSDVAHSCHLLRFNYVKVNADIFLFHSPCCNHVCMFNYMFPHLGEVQVWSREQWKYVTCFCTKVLLHWKIKKWL